MSYIKKSRVFKFDLMSVIEVVLIRKTTDYKNLAQNVLFPKVKDEV